MNARLDTAVEFVSECIATAQRKNPAKPTTACGGGYNRPQKRQYGTTKQIHELVNLCDLEILLTHRGQLLAIEKFGNQYEVRESLDALLEEAVTICCPKNWHKTVDRHYRVSPCITPRHCTTAWTLQQRTW